MTNKEKQLYVWAYIYTQLSIADYQCGLASDAFYMIEEMAKDVELASSVIERYEELAAEIHELYEKVSTLREQCELEQFAKEEA